MKAPSRFSRFVVTLKKRRSYAISEQFRKTEILQFFLLFCTNKEQIKNKILFQRAFPAVQNRNQPCLIKNKIGVLQKVNVVSGFCAYGKIFILYKTEKHLTFVLISDII